MMNTTILEYFTVVDTDLKSLDKQVNSLVKDGYQPYGNPYAVPGEKVQFCQAVVMYEESSSGMNLSAQNPL
jgi:hypothetical protein